MPAYDASHILDMETTAGPPGSLWDNIKQSYLQQVHVDSPYSLDFELEQGWEDSLALLRQTTGEDFDLPPSIDNYSRYARFIQGRESSLSDLTLSGKVPDSIRKDIDKFKAVNDRIKALGNPDIKSFEEILAEVSEMQQRTEERTQKLADTSGFIAGFLGQLVGAIGGTFTIRDPFALATLGIGGVGRTVAARIASEFAIGATFQGVSTGIAVNPNREVAGLQSRSVLFDSLAAGIGAGGLTAGAIGISRGLRRLRGPELDIEFDFSDSQLRQMFERHPNNPDARAALMSLDAHTHITKANVYGNSPAGLRRFVAELNEMDRVMSGLPARQKAPSEIKDDIRVQQEDLKIAKDEEPIKYSNMETAQQRVVEIDEEINDLTAAIDRTTLSQAVRLVDEDAAARLAELEELVNSQTTSAPARAAAEIEAQAITNRVGVEKVATALSNAEIAPRKRIQWLRKRRKAAVKNLRRARNEVENVVTRINDRKAALEASLKRNAAEVMAFTSSFTPIVGPKLQFGFVKEVRDSVLELSKNAEVRGTNIVSDFIAEEGKVDIGLKDPVPEDFRFDSTDEAGTVRNVSLREALDDLDEDATLDDIVRNCPL